MHETTALIQHYAASSETVHFHGERGTGKSWAAELLHAYSARAQGPFRYLNLAGLDDSLASAELCGHVRGAFTDAKQNRCGLFAEAGGGSLLLDEIGKASLVLQRKLLDIMERMAYRPVGADRDVRLRARLMFAANEPLVDLVASGQMLPDFFSRLGLFSITLPPLRDRRADIPELLPVLLRRKAAQSNVPSEHVPRATDELLQVLSSYDWPGNLRELESVAARLLVDARGAPTLGLELLRGDLARYRGDAAVSSCSSRRPSPEDLRRSIKELSGKKGEAAKHHGISRTTAWRILNADASDALDSHQRQASR